MYCGKCEAYIPEGPGINTCLECGAPVGEAKKARENLKPQTVTSNTENTVIYKTEKSNSHKVLINGFEGRSIEVVPQTMFGTVKLLIDGQVPPKGPKANQIILRQFNGHEVIATWKPKLFGMDVPDLLVDGTTVQVVEPLKWHEWLWAGLPLSLIFFGGALGGGLGALAFSLNIRIFRSSARGWLKFIGCMGISLITVLLFVLIAALFFGTNQKK